MWPFSLFKKKQVPEKVYKYDSKEFVCPAEGINEIINKFLAENPNIIPINIAVWPSRISGVAQAVLLYKVEVK
ncbi:MAG TPA: hypothetical protein PK289_04430 [Bacteroidia bacterium]|nr:hypothetical protein [Bacteroidia bacterium]